MAQDAGVIARAAVNAGVEALGDSGRDKVVVLSGSDIVGLGRM